MDVAEHGCIVVTEELEAIENYKDNEELHGKCIVL